MIEMKLNCNPFDVGKMFKNGNFTLYDGITVLVGCNGAGKTTFMNMILDHVRSLSKNDSINIECFKYNNISDGGSHGMSEALLMNNIEELATIATSSEGEGIIINLGRNLAKIKSFITKHNYSGDIVFCIDGFDSGTSIDVIMDIKESLYNIKKIIEKDAKGNVYIIITSNSYELTRGERCYDVQNSKYVEFSDYEDFRRFILKSKHSKDVRNARWERNEQNRIAKEKDNEAIEEAARRMREIEKDEHPEDERIQSYRKRNHSLIRSE